jgi:hypothetical protein
MEKRDYNMMGVLSKNDRKTKDDHPDFSGQCTIEGTEYWMNAWKKEKNGKTFLSFAFKRKDEKPSYSNKKRTSDDPF